jgi:lysophospholipase L1-like esterase
MVINRWRAFLIALLFMQPLLCHSQNLALRDGDRVVFYGDSITAQRFYTRFVEDIVLTRYPTMHVTFVNAGVPGDTVYGGYTGDQATRLKRDVFPQHPSVVTIMLGMNDGYYVPFEQKYFDIYTKGYRALLSSMQSNLPAVRITLLTPTPYDEVTHGTEFAHYNEVVSRHAAFVRTLGASDYLPVSNFYKVVADLTSTGTKKDPPLAALLVPDRIHPAETAHWVMAAELARTWGVSPIVSRVSLDGSQATVLMAENTHITALQRKGAEGLSWTQLDNSLPLPLPLENEMMQFVLGISDLAAMDQQVLKVANLPRQHYVLQIDGKVIGNFTGQQLATGVNLALYQTPMQGQAKDVDGTEFERVQLDQAMFILTINDPKSAVDPVVTRGIEAKEAALLEEERKACLPHPHTFELLPQ